MTLRKRWVIFYLLALVFLISGAGLLSYSNGWRLDLETLKVSKTGGLFVETGTADTKIKVGKKAVLSANSLLSKGTFISGLFPKTYAIEASKDGYQSWNKTLEIKPELVTKTLPIVLVPQKPDQKLIAKNIINFWAGPNQNLAWLDEVGRLFINKKLTPGNQILNWSNNGGGALIFDNINEFYYAINLAGGTALRLDLPTKSLQNEEPIQARMDPLDKGGIVFKTSAGIYTFDVSGLELTKIFKQPASNLYVFNGDLIWLGQKQIYSLHRSVDSQLVKDVLFSELTKDKNAKFELSPDKEKLIVKREGAEEMTVYFLKDNEALNKKAGDFVKIRYLSDVLSGFGWHKDSAYLFAQYPSGLYFGEIDNRDSINLQLIANSLEKFQYDADNNLLYVLTAGSLYKIDSPN